MKQIINNQYLKVFSFCSFNESETFFANQNSKKKLFIENSFGDNYFCYVCYHTLTREKKFALSFCSDENDDKLNFLFWNNSLIMDTGREIYFIDENLNIKVSFEITTPLIGFYLIDSENLLLLEEAYLRVINFKGEIVKSKLFDLIEDFSLENNLLSIQTIEENIVFKLT